MARERIAGAVAVVAALSLVTNRWPLLTVGAFGLTALLAARKPDPLGRATIVTWGYWILSFLLTTEAIGMLASFEFHRRDGQIFFSLLPLLALSWCRPSPRAASLTLAVFCSAQALVAGVACAADAFGARESLAGLLFLDDEKNGVLNYCALYMAHNAAGSVQALCCVAAAAMSFFSQGTRTRWFWGLLSMPLLWGVVLSKSRGALLALFFAFALLAILAARRGLLRRHALTGVATAVFLTAIACGPALVERFGKLHEQDGTHVSRFELWKRALEEWSWSPIGGEGLGRYNDLDRRWSGPKHVFHVATAGRVVNAASHAHNSYLHFLAEGGVLGLLVTAGLWSWIAWKLRGAREPLRVAALAGVLLLFAISFTEHYMGGGAMLLVLSCLAGAAWNLRDEPLPVQAG